MKSERRSKREERFRRQRAVGLVALGLVSRAGRAFRVTMPFLREKRRTYTVWKEEGRVRCDCDEFAEGTRSEAKYRCLHILAVKHALETGKVVEPKTEPPPAPPPDDSQDSPARRALARHAARTRTPAAEPAPAATRLPSALRELAARFTLDQVTEALDRVAPAWCHRIDRIASIRPATLSVAVTLTVGRVAN